VNLFPLNQVDCEHYLSVEAKSNRVASIVVVKFDYVLMLIGKLAVFPSGTVAAQRLNWTDHTEAHFTSPGTGVFGQRFFSSSTALRKWFT
jgi:hypothetical protein